ncbi:MAG: R3H domain-containing nucleic acid-binding protein [Patescibacteria group bacterium]
MTSDVQGTLIKYIHLMVDPIDPNINIAIQREGDQWRANLVTEAEAEFTVADGELVRSIQHVARVLVHRKYPEDRSHFILDVNNYRKLREHSISNTIPILAKNDVLADGNTIILVGLSGYERLQVHRTLSEIKGLNTNSVGPSNNRKLLIMPTSETGSSSMDKAKIYTVDQIKKIQVK